MIVRVKHEDGTEHLLVSDEHGNSRLFSLEEGAPIWLFAKDFDAGCE